MRKFYMLRHEDVNGFSGTGVVAEGVIFDDGTGAFTWLTPMKTVTVFTKMADIRRMHGHGGKTEIVIESNKKKYLDCVACVKELKIKNKTEKRLEEDADGQAKAEKEEA